MAVDGTAVMRFCWFALAWPVVPSDATVLLCGSATGGGRQGRIMPPPTYARIIIAYNSGPIIVQITSCIIVPAKVLVVVPVVVVPIGLVKRVCA